MKHMATDVAAELVTVELIANVSIDVLVSAGLVTAGSTGESRRMGIKSTYGNSDNRKVGLWPE